LDEDEDGVGWGVLKILPTRAACMPHRPVTNLPMTDRGLGRVGGKRGRETVRLPM